MAHWQHLSTHDDNPTHTSEEQELTERACRALFEEWRDLDGSLHRETCAPPPAARRVAATYSLRWPFAGLISTAESTWRTSPPAWAT